MPTPKSQRLAIVCASCLLACLSTSNAATTVVKKVRSSAELVNAMVVASNSATPTVIKLVPGIYSFAVEDMHFTAAFGSAFGPSVLPPVQSAITLEGASTSSTVITAELSGVRVLTVLQRGQLVLRNLTITGGGQCQDERCGGFDFGGGGVGNFGGSLQLDHTVVSGNIAPLFTEGGGILNWDGSLQIDDSRIEGNISFRGGGLAMVGGSGAIRRSIIQGNGNYIGFGNGGSTSGGGILVHGGVTMSIDRSTIAGNTVGNDDDGWLGFGGGIYNGGNLKLSHSAVTGNDTHFIGAGGGIFNEGTLTVLDSTIGGNTVGTLGGGLYNEGSAVLQGVTIADNSVIGGTASGFDGSHYPQGCDFRREEESTCYSGGGGVWNQPGSSVRIVATIIAGNAIGHGWPDCSGNLSTEGHNILGNSLDCTLQRYAGAPANWQIVDQIDVDPLLGPLHPSDEPGYVYYPLLPGSPAIDQGGRIGKNCSTTDQNLHARVDGDFDNAAQCDIGATEFRWR